MPDQVQKPQSFMPELLAPLQEIETEVSSDNSISKTAGFGRWTKDEHKAFLKGLQKFGRDWRKIEEYIGSRSGAQIRSHAQKYFIKMQKDLNEDSEKDLTNFEDVPVTS